MSDSGKVAVQATKREFYGLKHPVDGPLNPDGSGEWSRDAYTFSLRDEKAIRLIETDAATSAEPKKGAGSSAKE